MTHLRLLVVPPDRLPTVPQDRSAQKFIFQKLSYSAARKWIHGCPAPSIRRCIRGSRDLMGPEARKIYVQQVIAKSIMVNFGLEPGGCVCLLL